VDFTLKAQLLEKLLWSAVLVQLSADAMVGFPSLLVHH
jgi:hypothetical protein